MRSPATEEEARACFFELLPDAVLQHALAFTMGASVVRAAATNKRLLRAAQEPSLWSALARHAFARHDCAVPFPDDWDGAGTSLRAAVRAEPSFDADRPLNARLWATAPRSWPRCMRPPPPPPPRALASGRRDDRPRGHDLALGRTAVQYLPELNGTGYDVCVRSDAPFAVDAPCDALLVVPSANGWAAVGGAYFEVALAAGSAQSPGLPPPCVAIGVCKGSFRLRGKQPGWTRSSWAYHGDDGCAYHGSGASGARFGPRFGAGDVVGCGLCRATDDGDSLAVYYVLNGRPLGVAHLVDGAAPLYAVVGMDSPALRVTVNFGLTAPFVLSDGTRRNLETVLCRGSAWAREYPPGMGDSDDSDGDFDEGDTPGSGGDSSSGMDEEFDKE